MAKSAQVLVEQFLARYLNEFDYRYAKAGLPIDPAFLRDVETASEIVIGAIGAGFFGKMGSDLYDRLKSEVVKRASQRLKKSDSHIFQIVEKAGTGSFLTSDRYDLSSRF